MGFALLTASIAVVGVAAVAVVIAGSTVLLFLFFLLSLGDGDTSVFSVLPIDREFIEETKQVDTIWGTRTETRLRYERLFWILVGSGLLLLPVIYLLPAWHQIKASRRELRWAGTPAAETHPELVEVTRKLAQQADIAQPQLRVLSQSEPRSYTIGGQSKGRIFITEGLIEELAADQLEAVIAHEISHLVNGDSRIMEIVLFPTVVGERVFTDPSSPEGYVLWGIIRTITSLFSFLNWLGVASLSRGREFAADEGAALLTGSPSVLTSALQQLDETRQRPSEDKRTTRRSISSLNILPQKSTASRFAPLQTHPSTERRIQRLEAMVVEQETD